MIHHHFVILELLSPVLKSVASKFGDKNFHDFCVIRKNHDHENLELYGSGYLVATCGSKAYYP